MAKHSVKEKIKEKLSRPNIDTSFPEANQTEIPGVQKPIPGGEATVQSGKALKRKVRRGTHLEWESRDVK